MEWIEAFVETTQEGLEIVSGALYQCGLTGLQIEDSNDFTEFLENPNRQWDYIEEELVEQKKVQPTGITFFVRDNLHGREQLAQIRSALTILKKEETEFSLGTLAVSLKNRKEEDWANQWKKYFKPFQVGEKLIVKPSWEEVSDAKGKKILNIDPGHIFGTGTHETTQLCMELLESYLQAEDRVFDIGCGSGILSIAALLLGAGEANAVDIDPNAVDIAYENAKRNQIETCQYHVFSGNILEDKKLKEQWSTPKYDLVVANIVADIIIALSKQVPDYLKKGGIFLSSGIICERLEEVTENLKKNGFTVLEIQQKKDWAAVACRYDREG